MENNQPQNQFPSFGNGQQSQGANVPPPPSTQDQVGVRTMESDAQSIRQSGGEQPQSQIMNAGTTPAPSQESSFSFQPPFQQSADMEPTSVSEQPMPEEKKSSFSFKTILIIIGIIVVAVAVGFGVFYLVQSLNSTPTVPTATTTPTASLPVATNTPSIIATTTPTSSIQEVQLPPALVHASLFGSASSTQVVLTTTDLAGVKSAIASTSAQEKLVAGSIKDIAFVDGANAPIEASVVVSALFPLSASDINSVIKHGDLTTWFYGDKSGGNKLGFVIPLTGEIAGTSIDQTKQKLSSFEKNSQDILNIFIPTVKLPAKPTFKEGPIGDVTVRYLAISTTNQQVFEYAPVVIQGAPYVIITSSYNQMVDALKRLDAKPFITTSSSTPELMPVITSTSTATTSTTTP
jgi:hypothetical protein